LEEKKFSDYDILLKTGAVHKSLIGLISFLLKNEQALEYVKQGVLVQVFLINALLFLKRTVTNNASWEPICLIYSTNISVLSVDHSKRVIQ
jgi:aminopeptidase-like protein